MSHVARLIIVMFSLIIVMRSTAAGPFKEYKLLRVDRENDKAQKTTNKPLTKKSFYSSQKINTCPQVLLESLSHIYSNGTVGNINYIFSDGSLKDPRNVCSASANNLKKVDPIKLDNQIKNKFPNDQQLSDIADLCIREYQESIEVDRKTEDKQLAMSYLIYDFNYKNHLITNVLMDLLDLKSQMNAIISGEQQDCKQLTGQGLIKSCQSITDCSHQNQKKLFDIKANDLYQGFKKILLLENEYNKLRNKKGHITNYSKAKEITEVIKVIEYANPLLMGEHLKKVRAQYKTKKVYKNNNIPIIDSWTFNTIIKKQLETASLKIDTKISDFTHAHNCLNGKEFDCDDFHEIIVQAKYNPPTFFTENAQEINKAAVFHSCIERIKKARNEADKVLDEVVINTALTFTPLGAIGLIKSASSAIKSVRILNNLKWLKKSTARAGMTADIGYGGMQSAQLYRKCQKAKQELDILGKGQVRSCQDIEKLMIANSHNNRCETELILTAALMAPLTYSGLKLHHVNSGLRTDAQLLLEKVRKGKSLTTQEELRLLEFYKKNNPIDKLVIKKISPEQRSFVEQTLKKLYAQKDVHPNDLIRLSKLIRPTNPPMLMVSRFTNAEKILESKRLWGKTEGAVYSSPRPAETFSQHIKSGVIRKKDQTTFIFTPQAAALFKPHEIEGIYSGYKRLVGQHKGPFGDIIIEEHSQMIKGTTIINEKAIPHNYVVIKKARRTDPTKGEKLFAPENQSATKAALRKAGRIATIETSAGLIAFFGWVHAANLVENE